MTWNVVLAVKTSAEARTPVYFSITGAAAAAVVTLEQRAQRVSACASVVVSRALIGLSFRGVEERIEAIPASTASWTAGRSVASRKSMVRPADGAAGVASREAGSRAASATSRRA